ncbi:MAG: uracil-DNA glycosylase family protein [Proteobacteria bacterium]|nr:uracil-DNA glycosylase family protein [Pseudomonadota bacterium]
MNVLPSRARRDSRRDAAHAGPGLARLLERVRACRVCAGYLPLEPRPLLQAGADARILIVGQAPGRLAHTTGIPWSDPSGVRLRAWMGISPELFYDASRVAIIPMGYCYPGRGRHGDRPPRRECAELWLAGLLAGLPRIELTLLVGSYAQRQFLAGLCKSSLALTVRAWREYAPRYLPLPHPSPRNQPWLVRNAWFERELLPTLQQRVAALTGRRRGRGAHGLRPA